MTTDNFARDMVTDPASDRSLSQHSVLIVDDESSTVALVKRYLSDGGFRSVLTVVDSRQALPMMFSWKPDLVILDLCMPEVTGIDILEAMRNDQTLGGIAVVVITAISDDRLMDRVRQLGVSSIVHKPFEADEVIRAACSALLPAAPA